MGCKQSNTIGSAKHIASMPKEEKPVEAVSGADELPVESQMLAFEPDMQIAWIIDEALP